MATGTTPSVTPTFTLGKPAISEGAAKDPRATIGVLGNIRQRIEALERATLTVNSVATASSNASDSQISAIRQQIAQILQEIAALEQADADLVTLIAGETLSAQQAVVMSAEEACVAFDPNDPQRSTTIVGLTTTAAGAGAAVTVRRRGFMALLETFDAGRPVYATATGLSQLPSYGSVAGLVGRMLTTSDLWIDPGVCALYLDNFDPGFEDFYPVTLALVRRLLNDVSGGDIVLYDDQGRAALTSEGGAIIMASGG